MADLPPNYRLQDTCPTCRYVIPDWDYFGDPDGFFCGRYIKRRAEKRRVDENCVCDEYASRAADEARGR